MHRTTEPPRTVGLLSAGLLVAATAVVVAGAPLPSMADTPEAQVPAPGAKAAADPTAEPEALPESEPTAGEAPDAIETPDPSLLVAPAPEVPELSLFQWALMTGGGLLLVPDADGGALYPAERVGEGVIETLPPKIKVRLHHSGQTRAVALTDVLAPQEARPADWRLEIRRGEAWVPARAMIFHESHFYAQEAPGPFHPLEHGELRLVRR